MTNLTKREQFAMAAMQGLLTYPFYIENPLTCAERARKLADALISELDKKERGSE